MYLGCHEQRKRCNAYEYKHDYKQHKRFGCRYEGDENGRRSVKSEHAKERIKASRSREMSKSHSQKRQQSERKRTSGKSSFYNASELEKYMGTFLFLSPSDEAKRLIGERAQTSLSQLSWCPSKPLAIALFDTWRLV